MSKIPSYPICKTYENSYTFMNLEKSKNWKNPKNPNFKIQKSKNPKSNYEHHHTPIKPSFIYTSHFCCRCFISLYLYI